MSLLANALLFAGGTVNGMLSSLAGWNVAVRYATHSTSNFGGYLIFFAVPFGSLAGGLVCLASPHGLLATHCTLAAVTFLLQTVLAWRVYNKR